MVTYLNDTSKLFMMATETIDAGFGRNSTVSGRLILADGMYNVKRLGIRYFAFKKLVTMTPVSGARDRKIGLDKGDVSYFVEVRSH